MKALFNQCREFLQGEDGPTTVEYAVLLALIITVALGAITMFGSAVRDSFAGSAQQITGS